MNGPLLLLPNKSTVIARQFPSGKNPVSSASCEKPEATVAHLSSAKSEYPNIVTVNLFDD